MKRLLLLLLTLGSVLNTSAQLLTWTPPFPKEDDAAQSFVITMDATKGNQGLLNHTPTSDVYVHIGAITTTSNGGWSHVPFTWATTPAAAQATYIGNNKWTYTFTGSLRTFFNLAAGENLLKVAILFRNGAGTKKQTNIDGSDMYVPIYTSSLAVRIDQPGKQPTFTPVAEPQAWSVGTSFSITANANKPSTLKLYHNSTTPLATATNATTISGNSAVAAIGNQQIIVEANDGSTIKYDTLNIFVSPPASPVAALPAGVKDGINYETDATAATLVLRAPGKNVVSVIGDFNNWTLNTNYIMNKTPDGRFFWLRLTGLTPGTEYGFQYVVDNGIKIADPYAQLLLDPNNDQFISSTTYPNLKPYPAGQSGIVGVLRTAAPTYTFTATNYVRPDKRGLVIYEMLVRDFVAAHDWKTVGDSLNYLKSLGVNAIEIMPFNEFEGNESWGYNGYQYFAPDKYYGPALTLKRFIDSCHKKGIAVIMDIVLNHTYGPSPLARLYWNQSLNRPAADNPWYNQVQPHAFGFGEDFNHDSEHTKYFFNRVLQHWITEYKVDGYRVDFSKGLTQRASTNDGEFSAYDATRIAHIMGYVNAARAVDPATIIILEHFTDNTEEKQLADSGLLIWSRVYGQYQDASRGFVPGSNFDNGIYTTRGWTNPHLVTFMESHDEERIVRRNITEGLAAGSYNIRDTATALKRMELNAAFFLTIPGPKMIWQFGELGYDYGINYCTNGTYDNGCRTGNKPIRWDYLNDARRKSVHTTYSKLNALRFHPKFAAAFQTGAIERSLSGAFKWIKVTTDSSKLVVVGNFDVTATSGMVTFPTAGTWYDYLNNTTFTAVGGPQSINLAPGEFHIYENRNLGNLATTPVTAIPISGTTLEAKVFPNPAKADFTVELYVPQTAATSFELLTTGGQAIGKVKQSFLVKGKHQVVISRNGLASGNYYLRIVNKTATKILSVVLQ
ncbi:MAG: hypothetical protein JWP69_483 [Flaviaesturariibacter sp.]|nr:hypothetical protein [Flaviaesturariibacter sp.]